MTISEDRITALVPSTGTSVAKFGDAAEVRMKLQIMRASVPGLSKKKRKQVDGRWVETDEYTVPDELVVALVVAEARSGLSAARGEIGVIPGSGLYVASKVKFADAIRAASERKDPIIPEYRRVLADPADPLWPVAVGEYGAEPGDTVAAVSVRSHVATQAWYASRNAKLTELNALGIKGFEAMDHLNREFGERPPLKVALGVVKGSENFDGSNDEDGPRWRPRDPAEAAKFDKRQAEKRGRSEAIYSKYDRACKRAMTRLLSQYGLAAPDTRNYGASAAYMVEEEASPSGLIASATLSDDDAALRRAQVEAEMIAATMAPPPPPQQPIDHKPIHRTVMGNSDTLFDEPPLEGEVVAEKSTAPPKPATPREPMSDERRAAIERAADWLQKNPRITADNSAALRSHVAATKFVKTGTFGTLNDLRDAFAAWVSDQIIAGGAQ